MHNESIDEVDKEILEIVRQNKCLKQFSPTTHAISQTLVIEEMNLILVRNWYGQILGFNIYTHKLEKNYSVLLYKFYRTTHMVRIPHTNHILIDHFYNQSENITLVALDLETGKNFSSIVTQIPPFTVQKMVISPYNPDLVVIVTGKTFDIYVYNLTDGKLKSWGPTLMNPLIKRYYEVFDLVYLPNGLFLSSNQLVENYEYDNKSYAKENETAFFAVWNFSLPPEKNLIKKYIQSRSYSQIMPIPQNQNQFLMRPYEQEGLDAVGGVFDYSTLKFNELNHTFDSYQCEMLTTSKEQNSSKIACLQGNLSVCQNMSVTVFQFTKDFKNFEKETINLSTGEHFISEIKTLKNNPNKILLVIMHDNMHSYEGVTYNLMDILEWDLECQQHEAEVKVEL